MIVKFKTPDLYLPDLKETFETLRRYGMKLNPKKCSLRVLASRFPALAMNERDRGNS